MKFHLLLVTVLMEISMSSVAQGAPPESNGIAYPEGWQDWSTIAVSHRTDNNTLRVILGNDVAVEAARSGKISPWPDGAVIGKVVWKETDLENWPAAKVPSQFVHAEFMFKDAKKYKETGGWGWARWVGSDMKPFGDGMQACVACHTPVAQRDWVFSDPAILPTED
jgi:hypothetical protein